MDFEEAAWKEISAFATGVSLRRPSAHQSFFKYVGLNTKTSWDYFEKSLTDFELLGSTAASLNDPFELSPSIFNDLNPTVAAIAAPDRSIEYAKRIKESGPPKDYQNLVPYEAMSTAYINQTRKYSRIISFCERSDSPLLWSHYSHSYQGACFHFIGRAFRDSRQRFGYVNYSDHRPVYPLSLALALASQDGWRPSSRFNLALSESDKLLFFTKARDWAYESEIRLIHNVNREKTVKFDPDGLLSIIVGPRMSDESLSKLKAIVARSPIPNLMIRKARLSGNSFSVEIEDPGLDSSKTAS